MLFELEFRTTFRDIGFGPGIGLPNRADLYGIGQTIIFLSCGFFLSFFFPRLISAAADWMSTILRYMANLECRSEMCCKRLAGNTGRKNDASHNFVGLYLRN